LLLLLRLQLMRERCAAVADHASPARRSRTGASRFESVARFAVQARASRAVASKLSLSLSLAFRVSSEGGGGGGGHPPGHGCGGCCAIWYGAAGHGRVC